MPSQRETPGLTSWRSRGPDASVHRVGTHPRGAALQDPWAHARFPPAAPAPPPRPGPPLQLPKNRLCAACDTQALVLVRLPAPVAALSHGHRTAGHTAQNQPEARPRLPGPRPALGAWSRVQREHPSLTPCPVRWGQATTRPREGIELGPCAWPQAAGCGLRKPFAVAGKTLEPGGTAEAMGSRPRGGGASPAGASQRAPARLHSGGGPGRGDGKLALQVPGGHPAPPPGEAAEGARAPRGTAGLATAAAGGRASSCSLSPSLVPDL